MAETNTTKTRTANKARGNAAPFGSVSGTEVARPLEEAEQVFGRTSGVQNHESELTGAALVMPDTGKIEWAVNQGARVKSGELLAYVHALTGSGKSTIVAPIAGKFDRSVGRESVTINAGAELGRIKLVK
jgi:predicted deacylase